MDSEDRYQTAARALVLDPARPLGALDLTLYEVANVVGVLKGRHDAHDSQTLLKRSEGALARVDEALTEHAIVLATEHGLAS